MPIRLWRSLAAVTGELGLTLTAFKGGALGFWALNLQYFKRGLAAVDDVASKALAGTTGVAPWGVMRMRTSARMPGRISHVLLHDATGKPRGAIVSAHPDVIRQTEQFGFGLLRNDRGLMRINQVEVTRHLRVPASSDAIRWSRDTPYSVPWLKDAFFVFYHPYGDRLIVPVVGRDGGVVHSLMHPSIFGRQLGTGLKGTLSGRPIVLCRYPNSFTGAADEARHVVADEGRAIVAGLQRAGMSGPMNVYVARGGVVPNSVPGGIPMEHQSWLTLLAHNVEDVADKPFHRIIGL